MILPTRPSNATIANGDNTRRGKQIERDANIYTAPGPRYLHSYHRKECALSARGKRSSESIWESIAFRTSPHTTQQTKQCKTNDIIDENDGLTFMSHNFCCIRK